MASHNYYYPQQQQQQQQQQRQWTQTDLLAARIDQLQALVSLLTTRVGDLEQSNNHLITYVNDLERSASLATAHLHQRIDQTASELTAAIDQRAQPHPCLPLAGDSRRPGASSPSSSSFPSSSLGLAAAATLDSLQPGATVAAAEPSDEEQPAEYMCMLRRLQDEYAARNAAAARK